MPTAIVKLKERTNRVINVVKAQYGLRDKSHAIDKMAEEFEKQVLEPQLRPKFVERLKKIESEKSISIKNIDSYFAKLQKS